MITILDNFHTGSYENLVWSRGMKNVAVKKGASEQIGKLKLAKVDSIFHLGMPSSSPMYKKNPQLVGETINGALAIFELARKHDAKVVYASSSSLYNGVKAPQREDADIPVSDYYSETRLGIERIAELYRKLHGIESAGMRFFSVYGPREKAKGKYANIVSQFLWSMKAEKSPEIYGDGKQTRDFIYVGDVVNACSLAMEKKTRGAYNVGTGKATTFKEVVAAINRALGTRIVPKYVQNTIKNYVEITQADTAKSRKELGFEARVSLEEGIQLIRGV